MYFGSANFSVFLHQFRGDKNFDLDCGEIMEIHIIVEHVSLQMYATIDMTFKFFVVKYDLYTIMILGK